METDPKRRTVCHHRNKPQWIAKATRYSKGSWHLIALVAIIATLQAVAALAVHAATNQVQNPVRHVNRSSPPAIRGFADLHTHQFANLAFGGKAFVGNAFGPIEVALPHCDYVGGDWLNWVHGPGGIRDLLGQAVAMDLLPGHRVGGFPEFDGWPRWDSYTHQTMYEDWLHRALQGGLKLMVMLAVNNEFACDLIERVPGRSCKDMEAVDLQIAAAREMERYIDAKHGGPGRGWYRIVTSSQQAREVIYAGKLAVVLGIEVDSLFNCKLGTGCTVVHVRAALKRYHDMGVRHFFPIHFNSNEYGGAGLSNPLTTARNPFMVRDCTAEGYEYVHLNPIGTAATCNAEGLSGLGKSLLRELIRAKAIVDVDHMSALAFNDALTIAEQYDFPVVAGHTGFLDISRGDKRHEGNLKAEQVERIRRLGGMVAIIPHQGKLEEIGTFRGGPVTVEHLCGNSSETVAQAYLYAMTHMQGGPVGIGSDFNGLAGLPGPRFGPEACPGGRQLVVPSARLQYPFRVGATGQMMDRSVVGQKTFDFNEDGLAHVGMLPDLIADLEILFGGRSDLLEPLLSSAEGYIRMWEKVENRRFDTFVVPNGCQDCGDGSAENPFGHLSTAVDAAREGDRIFLSPGVYGYSPGTITRNGTLATWPGREGSAVIR